MSPAKYGLSATPTYNGPTGEERLLFLGIEMATKAICKGREIPPEDHRFYRKLIQRVEGLKTALEHRETMQGGSHE